jgi:hypothetical protein
MAEGDQLAYPTEADLVDLLLDGARYADVEDVQTALERHIDVNATDSCGRTGNLQRVTVLPALRPAFSCLNG